jgi:hypothetical protein
MASKGKRDMDVLLSPRGNRPAKQRPASPDSVARLPSEVRLRLVLRCTALHCAATCCAGAATFANPPNEVLPELGRLHAARFLLHVPPSMSPAGSRGAWHSLRSVNVQGETPADQTPDEFDEDLVVPLPMGTGASLGRFAIDEADEGEEDDGGVVGADGLPGAPVDGADSEADSSQTGLQRTRSKVRPPS